jgi:hypothetical protein
MIGEIEGDVRFRSSHGSFLSGVVEKLKFKFSIERRIVPADPRTPEEVCGWSDPPHFFPPMPSSF